MRVLLTLLMMTAAAHADEAWPSFGSPYLFTEQSGEAIYRSVCAGCHMPDGKGASGAGSYPSLANDPRLIALAYPLGRVLKGHKAMPPFAYSLTDAQVASVVTYIRSHFGNDFPNAPTAEDAAAER